MSAGPDYDTPCKLCGRLIGDHTLRGYAEELSATGLDYSFPQTDLSGALTIPGIDGQSAGEVKVYAAVAETAIGKVPLLRFEFFAPGAEQMTRVPLPPINLVMDAQGLQAFGELVVASVNRAITVAAGVDRQRGR